MPTPSASSSSPVAARRPSVRFEITPQTLDRGAKQVTLELGSQSSPTPMARRSPRRSLGPAPAWTRARLVFDPAPTGGGVLQANGPWALFRLFDQGTLQQAGSSDRYTLTFHVGDREASFEIRAGSVLNPFAPGMLHDFRCPGL